MLTGYHYTTQRQADIILKNGLKLNSLSPEHNGDFKIIESLIRDGVIWLYRKPHTNDSLLGMLIYVATNHHCSQVCCLRVKYPWHESATMLARRQSGLIVRFKHSLGAGLFSHFEHLIDLAIAPIPSNNIKLVDQWDLRDSIKRKINDQTTSG